MTTMMAAELLTVGSVVVIGALLGHYALLSISKRLKPSASANSVALHRLQALYNQEDTLTSSYSSSSSSNSEKTSLLRRRARPTTGSRGVIPSLQPYHSHLPSTTLPKPERESTLHKLILTAHDENPRSTYLGAETFNKPNPSAQLFGWDRTPGRATVELGDVACLVRPVDDDVCVRVVVHPDDAKTIADAGWGGRVDVGRGGVKASSVSNTGVSVKEGGVLMLVKAPRSRGEADRVTKVVLDAAVWFVAGLDREENV